MMKNADKPMKPETIARRAAERKAERDSKIARFRANYLKAQLEYSLPDRAFGDDEVFCYVAMPDGEVAINSNGVKK